MSDKSKPSHIERLCYVDPDTKPGDSISYGDLNEKPTMWKYRAFDQFGPVRDSGHYVQGIPCTVIEAATGSDYSGTLVERSNMDVLKERFPWLVTLYGGHGTFGVAYLGKRENQNPELIEAIDALADYPLVDEDHHSELEHKTAARAWEDDGRADWRRALVKMWSLDDSEYDEDLLDDKLVDQLWRDCCEKLRGGFEFLNEQGDSIYFPTDRVIDDIRRDRVQLYEHTWSDDNRSISEKLEELRAMCRVSESE